MKKELRPQGRKSHWINGPGMLVTAAFIGPGTVTICTLAGVNHGTNLLWTVLFSILITYLFQEMSSRIGIITQMDLTSVLRKEIHHPILKALIIGIVISAVVIGNAAYEAGNISGSALGLEVFWATSQLSFRPFPMVIGLLAFVVLWFGNIKILERTLLTLVGLMSISFLVAAIMTQPNWSQTLHNLFIPSLPDESLLTALALVGTTIVPYNLFLHASLSKSHWSEASQIPDARKNTAFSIAVGGLISLALVITASASPTDQINNVIDLGKSLEPLYGSMAQYLMAGGMFAAGLTSAITAPLAAAFVICGAMQVPANNHSKPFKLTWFVILSIGILFSSLGFNPIAIIQFAQVANGLLLPVIATLLIWLTSRKSILGNHRNTTQQTLIASLLLLIIVSLGIKTILSVF